MKKPDVILCFAVSKDGFYKPLQGGFKTSVEDQREFKKMLDEADATLMGADTARDNIERILKGLRPDLLRLGLTHFPERFQQYKVDGQLEFANMSADEAVDYLVGKGKEKIVVVSGRPANDLLLGNKLTSAQLTVEPVKLGEGLKLEAWDQKPKQIKLGYPVTLNSIGTQLYRYDFI